MTKKDLKVVTAMQKYGGSFVWALGEAARRADRGNLAILKKAFPEYWKRYGEMADDEHFKLAEEQ